MFKRMVTRFLTGMFCLLVLAGCGSGNSNTNGTLTLTPITPTDLTGGVFSVVAIATYANAANTNTTNALQGIKVNITMTAHYKDGTQVGLVKSDTLYTDSSGIVTDTLLVPQGNQTIYVDVKASSGGLSANQTVAVPSNVAMTASPSVVAFAPTATAGATSTVTITGGLAPYTAQIDAAHVADLSVTTAGNLITLTKLKNSGATPITATLTVSDSSGATPIAIVVSYN